MLKLSFMNVVIKIPLKEVILLETLMCLGFQASCNLFPTPHAATEEKKIVICSIPALLGPSHDSDAQFQPLHKGWVCKPCALLGFLGPALACVGCIWDHRTGQWALSLNTFPSTAHFGAVWVCHSFQNNMFFILCGHILDFNWPVTIIFSEFQVNFCHSSLIVA